MVIFTGKCKNIYITQAHPRNIKLENGDLKIVKHCVQVVIVSSLNILSFRVVGQE